MPKNMKWTATLILEHRVLLSQIVDASLVLEDQKEKMENQYPKVRVIEPQQLYVPTRLEDNLGKDGILIVQVEGQSHVIQRTFRYEIDAESEVLDKAVEELCITEKLLTEKFPDTFQSVQIVCTKFTDLPQQVAK